MIEPPLEPLVLCWQSGIASLILLYTALLISLVSALKRQIFLRRLSSYFVGFAFTIIIGFMIARLLWIPFTYRFDLEFAIILFALIPAGLFVFLRRETMMLAELRKKEPVSRFDQLKDEFLTVASHELRTPMSVINGFAEILVREKIGPLNDEQKRRIRKILMQGQRLNRIIDELLDLSRIRSGKIEVKKQVFDIVPVLKACLDDQQIVCEQQNIKLIDKIPDVLPDIEGDLERVTQVVINLLGNAVKYTPGGGEVRLSAEVGRSSKFVQINVVDTGIGISSENQAFVFDEFFRASSQSVTKCKGSGLGLAIVKQLVEAQGGRVGLRSSGTGQGSTFFFTIPAAKNKVGAKAVQTPISKVA